MANKYYVYILCNDKKNVLYVGVTNNICRRLSEHVSNLNNGFTHKYKIHKLIYAEVYSSIKTAILREKQIKRWSRVKKEQLINTANPQWEEIDPF